MNFRIGADIRASFARILLVAAAGFLALGSAFAQAPSVGPNVNMVTGTMYPRGDPWLTKQNEPSIAVSSRSSRTLLGGSNDYRMVNVPAAEGLRGAKAWLHIYKSVDGGTTWYGMPLAGCPDRSIPECGDVTGVNGWFQQLNADFSADPTVRAGPNGTFFYSYIAGLRGDPANGVVAVQRHVDTNSAIQRNSDVRACTFGTPGCARVYTPANCNLTNPIPPNCTFADITVKPAEDPIVPDVMWKIDQGTSGQDLDKPWNASDVHRSWNTGKTCDLLAWTRGRSDVNDVSQIVPAFNVYVSFANFGGSGQNQHPQAFVAVSQDCGTTFGKPIKLSNSLDASQGTSIAVDPTNGDVYVVWRRFGEPTGSPPKPDQIIMSKSSDGGKTWSNQPVTVATIIPYDQDAGGSSFRTLGFPSVAVSVDNGVSRVHVAWTQRKARPALTAPYGCPAADPADCDARIVIATSVDGGATWPAAQPVDGNFTVDYQAGGVNYSHQRGHQVQPALTFAAGKLLVTWIDQRLDHTEEVLRCPASGPCNSVNDLVSVREAKGNLDPACHIDVTQAPFASLPNELKSLLDACYEYLPGRPASLFTSYMTDGTPGLVRRHTVDIFAAMAAPSATPTFVPRRVSRYAFGSTVAGTVNPDGTLTPPPNRTPIELRQKEVNAPNLPMFSNGQAAFLGDYIDAIGQGITATDDTDPLHRYKFNVGGTVSGPGAQFMTTGLAPVFHVAFTDNRDVIPPEDGDWTKKTCLVTTVEPCTSVEGEARAGNRNQNVYSSVVTEGAVAYVNANSKLLTEQGARAFVVTVENLSGSQQTYTLTINTPAGVKASFDKASFDVPTTVPFVTAVQVAVQPRSSSTRSVWVRPDDASGARALIKVLVEGAGYSTVLLLNPDPNAILVANGDGPLGPGNPDLANNDLGNVVLSNAVLTNNVLSNNALSNAVLSNNALSNAVLSNVVLSNAVLSNVVLSNAVLSNEPLVNAVLSNVVLSNAVLSNDALINAVLSNAVLSNAVLSNNALSNVALTNVALSNVALSNAVLSNNALSNVALSNNALSNAVLSNAVLSNAALSNVVLSNNALSNAVLSNNALSNVVLSNAPLTDDDLKRIEPANPDIAQNGFQVADLQASNFIDASLTVRNRGNTDTTLAVKLLLRDASCSGDTGNPGTSYQCTMPPGFKLQLVLRKIGLTPVAIPPTGPALTTIPDVIPQPLALKLGLQQFNAQVSNVGTLQLVNDAALVDPEDPDLGRFLATQADAPTLPLAAGERAQISVRAIGAGPGFDPVEFLRWGVKFVVVDASNNTETRIPLIIKTFVLRAAAGASAVPSLQAFGGSTTNPARKWTVSRTLPGYDDIPVSEYWPADVDPTTGVVTVNSTAAPGTYRAYVKVEDFGGTNVTSQSDLQLVTLQVIGVPPTIPPVTELGVGQSVNLPATGSNGEIAVITTTSPPTVCTVTGPSGSPPYYTLTGMGPGTCTVVYTFNNGTTVITDDVIITLNFPVKSLQAIDFAAFTSPVVYAAQSIAVAPVSKTPNIAGTPTGLPVSLSVTGPCTLSSTTAPANLSVTGVGTCEVTASQGGTSAYFAATDVKRSVTITAASLVVTATVSPASITYGDDLVTGAVSYGHSTSGSDAVCLTPLPSVSVIGPAAPADAGNHNITPTVSGVSASCTLTLNSATLSVAKAQPVFGPLAVVGTPAGIGASGTLNRAVTGYGYVWPAEAIAIAVTGPASLAGSTGAPVGPDGAFTGAVAGPLAPGVYSVTLTYTPPGNGNFLSAVSAATPVRIESFAATGPMKQKRALHTATLLADGGRVLVAGGVDGSGASTATSEIYCASKVAGTNCAADADVGQFKAIGNLPSKSAAHTATLLTTGPNAGKVLVAGGGNSSTELYNPANNTWVAAGGLSSTRSYHTATPFKLPDGTMRILIAGGADNSGKALATTQVYNPATGTFSNGPTMTAARERHSATVLPEVAAGAGERVLIHGGRTKVGNGYTVLNSAEVLIPVNTVSAMTFVGVPQPPPASFTVASRWGHAAAQLATGPNTGRVLVAGGASNTAAIPATLASVDLFAPSSTPTGSGTWINPSALDPLEGARRDFTMTPLLDLAGRLLVAGGRNGNTALGTSELFDTGLFVPGPALLARSAHAAVRLQDGRVLVTGGFDAGGVAMDSAQIFTSP